MASPVLRVGNTGVTNLFCDLALHVSGLPCPVDLTTKSFTGSSQPRADPGNPYVKLLSKSFRQICNAISSLRVY